MIAIGWCGAFVSPISHAGFCWYIELAFMGLQAICNWEEHHLVGLMWDQDVDKAPVYGWYNYSYYG